MQPPQGQPAIPIGSNTLAIHCGAVSNYYNQNMEDWDIYDTGDWLNNWRNNNGELMANSSGRFAVASVSVQ
ncbi:hypothetical protein N7530_000610 [Penicillium desertorum]|jgi:hypothetical protein|uniref:Uncharacterized protein n=1 Tax=Penicillium desertorum TaxID=1303715 RepID=A0A9W9X9S6_9EURO|nr:hypothetical protein N7530_000610 [Penicillium desertorum]